MKKKRSYASDIMKDIPLPAIEFEKPRFVASITYQIPKRILLKGRVKNSPRFETMYGVLYWLNKQPYHMDYVIYRTDKMEVIRSGNKKIGETVK